ncbi:hypothetical protein [Luteibacter sp. 329MFSha]|uniref:hypothetical protein n=1 Tax=Luteibacter sp. 329MFSha TaxID=1798239 RepID=UPI0008D716CF|nr:hypothetical protein [Luteibacter sp. 329MFSha]SEV96451.1 hypothetical protein SAMN04515660_1352 [Luteibacter sp. 329MFSha]
MKVFFSDFFSVTSKALKDYGAFNVSLINDLPVFIDPFLLFASKKKEYRKLHDEMIAYVAFLRDKSKQGPIHPGLVNHWFQFKEVKQNWLGFSKSGNSGSGLGKEFATAMNDGLSTIFTDFGKEKITKGSHLEKICLIKDGVGKDNISDFTTNLIKGYLCEYTEEFASKHLKPNRTKKVQVNHAYFDYKTERWEAKEYTLPYIDGDYVLLTPRDILTKDDTWISRQGLMGEFDGLVEAMPNDQLRAQVENFFIKSMPTKPTSKDRARAKSKTIAKFPELIDRYIRSKEDRKDLARAMSAANLDDVESVLVKRVGELVDILISKDAFYKTPGDTLEEAAKRVQYLKQVVENNDGYRFFWTAKGEPISRETDLHVIYRLTWYASQDDLNAEVNNGRGPVDFKISRGSKDKTLVEFKLAKNSQLEANLRKQIAIYEAANETKKSIKVIFYFTAAELGRVNGILKKLKVSAGPHLVLIDARRDNKPSGSKAR